MLLQLQLSSMLLLHFSVAAVAAVNVTAVTVIIFAEVAVANVAAVVFPPAPKKGMGRFSKKRALSTRGDML